MEKDNGPNTTDDSLPIELPVCTDVPARISHAMFVCILIFAACPRFYQLAEMGYRFCDEGYHLNHSILYLIDHDEPFLYFKHGLHWFNTFGLTVFGLEQAGSLYWSAMVGLATIVFLYVTLGWLVNRRVALLGSAAMAVSHYVLFYHRSNMSDGHALMFFCLVTMLLVLAARHFGLGPVQETPNDDRPAAKSWAILVAGGLMLGFSFAVRIQTCIILVGSICAWGLALVLMRRPRPWKQMTSGAAVLAALAVSGYGGFMFYLRHNVLWGSTVIWYDKNFAVAQGELKAWSLYLVDHLTAYCSGAFLLFGIGGLIGATLFCRRAGFAMIWLVLCWWGLFAAFTVMGLPFPRAHLYLVLYLCIFWAIAIDWIGRRVGKATGRKWLGVTVAIAIAVVSAALELQKSRTLLNSKGGYREAVAYVTATTPGKTMIATHAWPIFRASHRHQTTVLYDYVNDMPDSLEVQSTWFPEKLRRSFEEIETSHMILDSYVPYGCSATAHLFLQRFCATYPPDLIIRNDFGLDAQTSWDAFRRELQPCMLARYHVIYRLERFAQADFAPRPLATATDVDRLELLILDRYLSTGRQVVE